MSVRNIIAILILFLCGGCTLIDECAEGLLVLRYYQKQAARDKERAKERAERRADSGRERTPALSTLDQ